MKQKQQKQQKQQLPRWRMIAIGSVALVMMFSGVGLLPSSTGEEEVKLGDRYITTAQLDAIVDRGIRQAAEEYGLDPAGENEFFRQQIASRERRNFASRFAALELIEQLGLAPTDEEVVSTIRDTEDFQVDGSFSKDRFDALISDERAFVEDTSEALTLQRYTQSVVGSEVINPEFAKQIVVYLAELRQVRKLSVLTDDFLSEVELTEGELDAYYQANSNVYSIPERAKFEILQIDRQPFEELVEIDEEHLKALFEQRNSQAKLNQERQLRLIVVEDQSTAAELVEQLNQDTKQFVELAKQYSQDAATAAAGGDLGLLAKEDLPEPVGIAVFDEAEVGDIVGPLEVDGSWQIYQVAGKIGGSEYNYAELRDDLIEQLKHEQSVVLFEEQAQIFSDQAFDLTDTLQPLAEQNDLITLSESDWIYLRPNAEYSNPEEFQDTQLLVKLFAVDIVGTELNSGLIEVEAGERYFIVRSLNYEPAYFKPYAEVEADVEQAVSNRSATRLALQHAQSLIEQLISGETTLDEFAPSTLLSQTEEPPLGFNQNDINATFGALDGEGIPKFALAFDADQATINILAIEKIISGSYDKEEVERISKQLLRSSADVSETLLLLNLFKRYNILIKKPSDT